MIMNKNIKILFLCIFLILIIIIVGIIFFFVGYQVGKTPAFEVNSQNITEFCFDLFQGRIPATIDQATGKIRELGENYFILEIDKTSGISTNFFLRDSIKIFYTENTKIFQNVYKTEEDYARELEIYRNLPIEEAESAIPPSFFIKKNSDLDAIKEDIVVTIKTAGEDLREKDEATAIEIETFPF